MVDQGGAVLATHEGVHGFTIGQRKGLGIAGPGPDGRPRYVTAIDADSGTVQVGSVGRSGGVAVDRPGAGVHGGHHAGRALDCAVQVRAHGETVDAEAQLAGGELVVRLRTPLRGVAPGQTLVLYRRDPPATKCSAAPPSRRRGGLARDVAARFEITMWTPNPGIRRT